MKSLLVGAVPVPTRRVSVSSVVAIHRASGVCESRSACAGWSSAVAAALMLRRRGGETLGTSPVRPSGQSLGHVSGVGVAVRSSSWWSSWPVWAFHSRTVPSSLPDVMRLAS